MRILKIDIVYALCGLSAKDKGLKPMRAYFLSLSSPSYQPIDQFTLIEIRADYWRFIDHFKIAAEHHRFCKLPKKALEYGCSKDCSDAERVIILIMALRYMSRGYVRIRDTMFSGYYGLTDEYWRKARARLRDNGIIAYRADSEMSEAQESMVKRFVGKANCWVLD